MGVDIISYSNIIYEELGDEEYSLLKKYYEYENEDIHQCEYTKQIKEHRIYDNNLYSTLNPLYWVQFVYTNYIQNKYDNKYCWVCKAIHYMEKYSNDKSFIDFDLKHKKSIYTSAETNTYSISFGSLDYITFLKDVRKYSACDIQNILHPYPDYSNNYGVYDVNDFTTQFNECIHSLEKIIDIQVNKKIFDDDVFMYHNGIFQRKPYIDNFIQCKKVIENANVNGILKVY